ncbi:MAG: geranylgeranyl reductase family protein [Candidatus Dormibacteria bacterium]
MEHERADLIVVGAGPGGSNAAAVALAGGLRVAQIDQAMLPRVKPCAGGLTMKTCRALRLDYAPWLRATTQSVEFNLWQQAGHRFTHRRRAVAHMVSRPEFDNALVEQNRAHPAFALYSGERVVDATYDGVFSVRTAQRVVHAPQLVAADGAYSTINRIFGVARPQAMAVAIEVNIARSEVDIEREPVMCFDFGAIESGYGWVFPKDDHWSVGLYTYSRGLKGLRSRLRSYIEAKGLAPRTATVLEFEAHQVPVGGYRLRMHRAPVYVVGDAGGFADALTGEGIYHAVESGRLAGETARVVHARGRSADIAAYRRRLWRTVLPDTAFTYHASRLFYAHLRGGIGALTAPGVWRVLIEGYADSATTTRSIARAPLYVARSLLRDTVAHDRVAAWPGRLAPH